MKHFSFYNQMMILLAMDLRTGYIFSEKSAQDRKYETWKEQIESAFNKMPINVRYLVSDRAPALIKLATEHFECKSGKPFGRLLICSMLLTK